MSRFDTLIYDITEPNAESVVPSADLFPLINLLPADTGSFARYEGSLTTPSCSEAVIWTVFTDKLKVTQAEVSFQITGSEGGSYGVSYFHLFMCIYLVCNPKQAESIENLNLIHPLLLSVSKPIFSG